MTDFFQFPQLDKIAAEQLLENSKTKIYQKGMYLLKPGEVCVNLFFIKEGLTKISFDKGDKEFIMRFFSENVLFTVFESYLAQAPSNYMITALEETIVTQISYDMMEELCKKHHSLETFFRKLVSVAAVKMSKRISEMLEENATERYNQFVIENKSILHRINLGDLAKYLGITQQSLSRIRSQKELLPFGKK